MKEPKKLYSIKTYRLKDDGIFPNSQLLVIHYKKIIQLPFFFPGSYLKTLFKKNNWKNAWKSGIYNYHHYHSTTHEVMGVYKGKTTLQLGGKKGIKIKISTGDVLIIPAGVAHKNLGKENAVKCVGAYPNGKKYDIKVGDKNERSKSIKNIKKVKMPKKDPVFGKEGGIIKYWT
ncbi:MAG: cupin domain-containing protein [Bacteroidota bacterium]